MDDREHHRALLGAEKADDATAIRIYRACAENYRRGGIRTGGASAIDALCDRLEAANARLARSGNYVADREVEPTCVQFCNGRQVVIRRDGRRAYLDVDWTPIVSIADAIPGDESETQP